MISPLFRIQYLLAEAPAGTGTRKEKEVAAIKTKDLYSWVAILLSLLLILMSVYLASWGNRWNDHDAQRHQHDMEQTFPLFLD